MAQVRIRKALQVKNRLTGEIANLNKLIMVNNSHQAGTSKFDVMKLLVERKNTVEKLISVKTALALANVAIYEKLARMSEAKDSIKFLRGLNTSEGETEVGYGERSKAVKVVASVNAVMVEDVVKALTLDIEKLQDEVDFFNSTTEITIPD
jgi:hypothetical protein